DTPAKPSTKEEQAQMQTAMSVLAKVAQPGPAKDEWQTVTGRTKKALKRGQPTSSRGEITSSASKSEIVAHQDKKRRSLKDPSKESRVTTKSVGITSPQGTHRAPFTFSPAPPSVPSGSAAPRKPASAPKAAPSAPAMHPGVLSETQLPPPEDAPGRDAVVGVTSMAPTEGEKKTMVTTTPDSAQQTGADEPRCDQVAEPSNPVPGVITVPDTDEEMKEAEVTPTPGPASG
ncbi:hypothetical protein BGZ99_002415, partial [Dissophora globulifera]